MSVDSLNDLAWFLIIGFVALGFLLLYLLSLVRRIAYDVDQRLEESLDDFRAELEDRLATLPDEVASQLEEQRSVDDEDQEPRSNKEDE